MQRLTAGPRWLITLAAILATSVLYFFSTGLDGIRPLVWVAPIPILTLMLQVSARRAAIAAFVAYFVGGLNLFAYLARLADPGVAIASALIPALAFMLAILAARYAAMRFNHWSAVLIFPVVWTSYEYFLSIVSPHGTAGSLAYTQTDLLPLIQLASLTGIWGITFIVTLVPAGLALAWHWRAQRRQAIWGLAVPLTVSLLAISFGLIRLAQPAVGQPIRVGLAATDTSIDFFETQKREEAIPVAEAYAHRVAELAQQGAEVVVLPEKFVGVTQGYLADVDAILSKAAQDNHVTVIAGLNLIGPEQNRNIAQVFAPDGKLVAEYQKAYLIPGFESGYQPGATLAVLAVSNVMAGVTICKDMDFPGWTARYARQGARILFVPSWDFTVDGRLHSQMAVMRGIEGGFTVVRSAQQGLVTVSNYRGQILAEGASATLPDVLLTSQAQAGPGNTVYTLMGDWFAWLCLIGLAIILAMITVKLMRGGANRSGKE